MDICSVVGCGEAANKQDLQLQYEYSFHPFQHENDKTFVKFNQRLCNWHLALMDEAVMNGDRPIVTIARSELL